MIPKERKKKKKSVGNQSKRGLVCLVFLVRVFYCIVKKKKNSFSCFMVSSLDCFIFQMTQFSFFRYSIKIILKNTHFGSLSRVGQ